MASTKSQQSNESDKYPIVDNKSRVRCPIQGECKKSDCPVCATYKQIRILKKKKRKPPVVDFRTTVLNYSEYAMRLVTFLGCISAAYVVTKRSDLVALEQLYLECIFYGLYEYICNKSFLQSAAIMFGGCGIWYINSTIGNKLITFVMLGCLQSIAVSMRYFLGYLMGYQFLTSIICEWNLIKEASITGFICQSFPIERSWCIVFLASGFEYFNRSSDETFHWGLEDPILLLLPFYEGLSYIMFGYTNFKVLVSLSFHLVWMLAKEYERR